MVSHMPWDLRRGGAQVQMALAAEFERKGCQIHRYTITDAFGPALTAKAQVRADLLFPRKAAHYVRTTGPWDVIDAHQCNLPLEKTTLGHDGLLVARSVGLVQFYARMAALESRRQRQNREPESLRGRVVRSVLRRTMVRRAWRSYRTADVINVLNSDERAFLARQEGLGNKTVCFPAAVEQERRAILVQQARDIDRSALSCVVVVGTWDLRKGRRDWPHIVRAVREQCPWATFSFVATGVPHEVVLRAIDSEDRAAITIAPDPSRQEFPKLLATAKAGALASYVEGFGIGVLEQLTAGIPSAAYAVPGVRDTIGAYRPDLLTDVGDRVGLAQRIVHILSLPNHEYRRLSDESARFAERFSWPDIASRTLDYYEQWLRRAPQTQS
jgi:glycosyltransferase involved in cell wall biosynthesis